MNLAVHGLAPGEVEAGKAGAGLAKAADHQSDGVGHDPRNVGRSARVYSKELYEQKCDVLYQHFYEAYMGQGKSAYAEN